MKSFPEFDLEFAMKTSRYKKRNIMFIITQLQVSFNEACLVMQFIRLDFSKCDFICKIGITTKRFYVLE